MHIDKPLTLKDIDHLLTTGKQFVEINTSCLEKIEKNRKYLEAKISDPNQTIYGINTGFGSLCNIRISENELENLQENLVLSHACGMGDSVPKHICKLILLLKIKNFTMGVSGVRPLLVQSLLHLYNQDIIPVIYQMGSLGASGDLAPLAHLSLVLLGKGEVFRDQEIIQTGTLVDEKKLSPISLHAKEGLALLNGTQFSLSYAVWSVIQGLKIFHLYNKIAAVSMEGFACDIAPFDPLIHEIRPHKGQILTAKEIYNYLNNSEIRKLKYSVQDPYSFRCVPQVHGATYQALSHVKEIVEIELNAATDNPNIFDEADKILSGGNFHAQPLALALDYLAIAIAELGSISERRVYQLINGERDLPAFLTKHAGLHSGFMIAQYTAASIVSQSKQYCSPASIDSIVSSKGQEDHVSMAANAATKCFKVIQNTKMLMAIEALVAAQALDFRKPVKINPEIEDLYQRIRQHVSFLNEDRLLHNDLISCQNLIEQLINEMQLED